MADTIASTDEPDGRVGRVVVVVALVFWTAVGLITGTAAQLTKTDTTSDAGGFELTSVRPEYRGQADAEALDEHGVSALASGTEAAARTGLAIALRDSDLRQAGAIVAHAVASEVVARSEPFTDSATVESFSNPTPRGGPLVFQALGAPVDGWVEVLLPVRPNGTTGWIPQDTVDLSVNPYRIEVDAAAHQLTIYHRGDIQLQTTVAIGNGETPTPLGEFYLVELLRPSNKNGPYGPYAYGLSGYSDTLDSFNGGQGVIGIHGTDQPELLGQDVSHGCIRVANSTIEEMTQFLPLGTPVAIFRSFEDPSADADIDSEPTNGGPLARSGTR